MKVVLPFLRVAKQYENFSVGQLDEVLWETLHHSSERVCYLEFSDDSQHWYLFFRDKQVYSAGIDCS